MAIYITTKCPHCKNTIKNKHKDNVADYYGSPFKKCPYCKNTYFDKQMEEPALFSQTEIFFKSLRSILTVVLFSWIFSIFIIGTIRYALDLPIDIEVFDSVVLKSTIPLACTISIVWLWLTKPFDWSCYIEPSLKRLKNKEYFEAYKKVNGNYIPNNCAYAKYMSYEEKD